MRRPTAEAPAPPPERPAAEAPGDFAVANPIHSAEAPAPPPTGTARDVGAADRRGTLDPHREARVPPTSFLRVAIFILFLVRVRRRIHGSLGRVTKRFGLALIAFSVSCTAVNISLLLARGEDDSDVAVLLSNPLSALAFVAHVSMTLPYPRTRAKLNFHVTVLALSTLAKGPYSAFGGSGARVDAERSSVA